MEITSRPQQQERETQTQTHSLSSPIPSPRPDNPPPYPTTFVQADTSTFKQVVQMLTGSSQPDPNPTKPHPPIRSTGVKKQNSYKLYERRNSLKNGLMINPTAGILPRGHDSINNNNSPMSPSMLNFPSLVLSPVTPLDHFNNNRSSPLVVSEDPFKEDRAIAEKGFYLHPSPRNATTPGSEPGCWLCFRLPPPGGRYLSLLPIEGADWVGFRNSMCISVIESNLGDGIGKRG